MTNTNDPATYRRMSEPFDSAEHAETALDAFCKELCALRVKHKMTDVLFVVRVNIKCEDGEEGSVMTTGMIGENLAAESLAAYALAQAQQKRQDAIAKLLKVSR